MQPSIDSFLEMYPEYVEMGKIAIAARLIPIEVPDNITINGQKPQNLVWHQELQRQHRSLLRQVLPVYFFP